MKGRVTDMVEVLSIRAMLLFIFWSWWGGWFRLDSSEESLMVGVCFGWGQDGS